MQSQLTVRYRLIVIRTFATGLFCLLTFELLAQQAPTNGVRLTRNESGQIIAVRYFGDTGLRNVLPKELAQLETVEITYHTRLTSDDIAFLATLENVTELVMGQDMHDENVIVEGDLLSLAGMKGLQLVFLCKRNVQDKDLAFVAKLLCIESLEFYASTSPWGEEGLAVTDGCSEFLAQATTLRALTISEGEKLSDQFISTISRSLSNLEYLRMDSGQLTDHSLQMLANRCTNLKTLDLQSDHFTDKGVGYLANAKQLENLCIRSKALTGACANSVAGLSQLRSLELTVPSIEDDDFQGLAKLPQLEFLALREARLNDKQFAMFKNHPTLKSAFLRDRDLSEIIVMETINTIPNLNHLHMGGVNGALQGSIKSWLAQRKIDVEKTLSETDGSAENSR